MSAGNLMRALAALGVLVLAWGAFTLFRGRLGESTGRLTLPHVALADVDRVEITKGADTVRLERSASGWTVNGDRADASEVRKLVEMLSDSAFTSELVARNPASHARMGVDDTAGRRIVLRKGGTALLDLVLGSPGSGYLSAYARVSGSDDVYLVRGALGTVAGREAGAWRDRQVAAIPGDSVGSVTIRHGSAEAVLRRDGDTWMAGDAPADTGTVRRLLGALASLTAVGFATPAEVDSLDFSTPDRRLTVLSRGADTLLDLLVDSTAAGFRVRTSNRPDVFQLDFWRVNELIPAVGALRPSGS